MRSAATLFLLLSALGAAAAALAADVDVKQIVRAVDERQRNQGDWKALIYMEQKEKDKTDVVYELVVYRRDLANQQLFLFTKPKSEAGKGYLRLEKNMWFYDPGVGRWERRTERERIGGTETRRSDLDESKLAEEYDATYLGAEKLGAYQVHKLELKVKSGVDVAFPMLRLWVDQATNNILKRQEFALSGRLMRTSYYPRWKKVWSESKKGDVWYPEEMRFFDEIEKANSTHIVIQQIDLRALEPNIFTKAWLESKSR
jgi:outer membrane lipoprotein-sorting protein